MKSKPAELAEWVKSRPRLRPDSRLAIRTAERRASCRSHTMRTRWSRSRAAMAPPRSRRIFSTASPRYVRDNINTIAALKLVVQRPRDLTRAAPQGASAGARPKRLLRGQSAPRLARCQERGHRRLDHRLRPAGRAGRSADALSTSGSGRPCSAFSRAAPGRDPQRQWLQAHRGAGRDAKSWSTARRSTRTRSQRTAGSRGSTRYSTASLRAVLAGINEEMWKKAS